MRRIFAAILIAAVALAAVVLVKLGAFAGTASSWMAGRIEQQLGRAVRFDAAEISVLDGLGISLRHLRIADDPSFSTDDFVLADELRLRVALWPLLRGRYEITAVAVDRPKINLIWDQNGFNGGSLGRGRLRPTRRAAASGDWRSFLGAGSAAASEPADDPPAVHVAKLEIRDGEIHFFDRRQPRATDLTARGVDASAEDFRFDAPFRAHLKAGVFAAIEPNLDLDGMIGPLGSPPRIETTPIEMAVKLGPVTLEQARSISPISRLLPAGLTSPEALTLRGTLKGAGENVDATAEGDLGGLPLTIAAKIHALTERAVEFVATAGDGKAAEARGSIHFGEDPPKLQARLRSSAGAWQGVAYRDLEADLEHASPLTTVQKFSFRAFDGLWNGSAWHDTKPPGSFALQSSVSDITLSLVLAGRVADPLIDGHLSADLMLEGPGAPSAAAAKTLRGDGYFEVKDGTLRIVDLIDQVLKATVAFSGITNFVPRDLRAKYAQLFSPQGAPFERLAGTVHVSDGQLRSDDLALVARDFTVDGSGTLRFPGDLEFNGRLLATRELTDDAIANFGKGKSLVNSEGRLELPFHVAGAFPNLRAELDAEVIQRVLGDRGRAADASAGGERE